MTVGDELLLGTTVDTNASWLADRLARLGLPVLRHYTVGDTDEEIRAAAGEALARADLVVVTGGLGPTPDDLTREAVAGLLRRPLHPDPEILQGLDERFRRRGYDRAPESNRRQADVPEGASVLPNAKGTAPGLLLEEGGAWIVLLPGVPREMRSLFDLELEPRVRQWMALRLVPTHTRTLHTTGIAESELCIRVDERLGAGTGPVRIAYLPSLRGVDVRLAVPGVADPSEAVRLLDRVEDRLAEFLSPYRFESSDGDLTEALAKRLLERAWTVAVAESCTGGLIGKRLTDRSGSSAYFRGGIVAYANEVKTRHLGVAQEVIESAGAVSREVAEAMATGIRREMGADLGVAITGIAGPEGGTPDKPVGTVCYAVALSDRTVARTRLFSGDREAVRERSAQAVLHLLYTELERT